MEVSQQRPSPGLAVSHALVINNCELSTTVISLQTRLLCTWTKLFYLLYKKQSYCQRDIIYFLLFFGYIILIFFVVLVGLAMWFRFKRLFVFMCYTKFSSVSNILQLIFTFKLVSLNDFFINFLKIFCNFFKKFSVILQYNSYNKIVQPSPFSMYFATPCTDAKNINLSWNCFYTLNIVTFRIIKVIQC